MREAFKIALLDENDDELKKYIIAEQKQISKKLFDVYRNNFYSNLIDVLYSTFPKTRKIIGDDCFKKVSVGYIKKYPPVKSHLTDYGDMFSDYIKNVLRDIEYISDIAKLEYLMDLSFNSPREKNIENFTSDKVFRLKKSVFLLQSNFPIDHIYEYVNSGSDKKFYIENEKASIVIFMQDNKIKLTRLEKNEYSFLLKLQKVKNLDTLMKIYGSLEVEFFAKMLKFGWLTY